MIKAVRKPAVKPAGASFVWDARKCPSASWASLEAALIASGVPALYQAGLAEVKARVARIPDCVTYDQGLLAVVMLDTVLTVDDATLTVKIVPETIGPREGQPWVAYQTTKWLQKALPAAFTAGLDKWAASHL